MRNKRNGGRGDEEESILNDDYTITGVEGKESISMTESSYWNELKDHGSTSVEEQLPNKEDIVNVAVKGSSSNGREDIEEGEGTFDEVTLLDRRSKSTSSSVGESSNGQKSNDDEHKEEKRISTMKMSNDDAFASGRTSFRNGMEEGSSKGNGGGLVRSSGNEWMGGGGEQSIVKQNRRFSWIQIKQVKHDVHTGYFKCSASNGQGTPSESEVTRIHIQRKDLFILNLELFSPFPTSVLDSNCVLVLM